MGQHQPTDHYPDIDSLSVSINLILMLQITIQSKDPSTKFPKYPQPAPFIHYPKAPNYSQLIRIIRFVHPRRSAVAYSDDLIVLRESSNDSKPWDYLRNPLTRQ